MDGENNNLETEQMHHVQRSNLTSAELLNIFISEMKNSASFKLVDEAKNPCHILFDGVDYYIYVKNISSAYFNNPDVSRAQLTGIDTLLQIKDSDALFILLGYDSDNRVFATWNPHMTKQRIGQASSPSFYSRFSWQKEAVEKGDFVLHELKNDISVLLFPQEYISLFLSKINQFFPDNSEYVAMGSKRRGDANAAYRELTNLNNLSGFADYLHDYNATTVQNYVTLIKKLINSSLISKYRRIFLLYDSLDEYKDAVQDFLALDDISLLNAQFNYALSDALPLYIEYLINRYGKGSENSDYENCKLPELQNYELEFPQEPDDSVESEDVDYESPYIDEHGILTCIANPKLIDLLRPDLDSEYPRPMSALATVEDFYGDRFSNMQLSQWQNLFNSIDWNNPYLSFDNNNPTFGSKRSARQKIRVTLSDGRVICENQVVKTLLEVIKYAGVEQVKSLNISLDKNGNSPLIDTKIKQDNRNAFKHVENGLYVNTYSDTKTKLSQIKRINQELHLNMIIELV